MRALESAAATMDAGTHEEIDPTGLSPLSEPTALNSTGTISSCSLARPGADWQPFVFMGRCSKAC